MKTTGTPINTPLDIVETHQGIKAAISPVTMTPTGAKWVTRDNDIWAYNSQCETTQKTTTSNMSSSNGEMEQEDFEEQLHSLLPTQARRTLDGQPWTGETWFKVKPDFNPPRPTIARPTPTRTDPHGPNEIQPRTARATRHTHEESIDKTTTTIMLTQSADTSTGE